MVLRQLEIDEDTDRLLTELAREYQGDLGEALGDLLHAREGIEDLAERSEMAQQSPLRVLRERSEADFRAGRTVSWDEVKARNGL